ncbi:MAG: hypothetical protein JRG97_08790 [Deltaproteobacteria bacterium]|nr:hypothetical protein [Deltaproteobacteria bacterium]MBW2052487.1 hypothetical protein [Deltaproteobacteria bacterium]MBW2141155.1 hypothetical protein [Deltaproteobacteria bacterium]MBW2322632.1 hypothetical protein [Deltaproteobacteria bacterium]
MAKKKQEIEVAIVEVVDFLRINGQFGPALRQVVERKVAAEAARKNGARVTTKQLQKAFDTFRHINGLIKASDTTAWLKSMGISLETLEDYLETNLLISRLKDQIYKKNASSKKYLSSSEVKETVRELAYQDWLATELK